MTQVWFAVVEHRHGIDISPCLSEEIAWSMLDHWAYEYWDQEFPDEPRPPLEDIQEVYFEKMMDRNKSEWASVDGPLVIQEKAWTLKILTEDGELPDELCKIKQEERKRQQEV